MDALGATVADSANDEYALQQDRHDRDPHACAPSLLALPHSISSSFAHAFHASQLF